MLISRSKEKLENVALEIREYAFYHYVSFYAVYQFYTMTRILGTGASTTRKQS